MQASLLPALKNVGQTGEVCSGSTGAAIYVGLNNTASGSRVAAILDERARKGTDGRIQSTLLTVRVHLQATCKLATILIRSRKPLLRATPGALHQESFL
jgi:hypothetical protein